MDDGAVLSNGETKPTAFQAKFSAELSNLRLGRTSRESHRSISIAEFTRELKAPLRTPKIFPRPTGTGGDMYFAYERKYIHADAITRAGGFALNI